MSSHEAVEVLLGLAPALPHCKAATDKPEINYFRERHHLSTKLRTATDTRSYPPCKISATLALIVSHSPCSDTCLA